MSEVGEVISFFVQNKISSKKIDDWKYAFLILQICFWSYYHYKLLKFILWIFEGQIVMISQLGQDFQMTKDFMAIIYFISLYWCIDN